MASMSRPEEVDEGGRLCRRKARSLDLGGSSSAAAWMWHMHMSTSVKNESLVQYAQRQASDHAWESKRSSSKDSRFRQEAVNVSSPPLIKEASQPSSSTVWDCGSQLYDTFELVSFSNRLDRSLLGVPALEAPHFHHAQFPLHHASVLRTLSLPRTLSLHSSTPPFGNASVQGLVAATKSKSSCTASAKWLAKFVKKVVSYHGHMWCFKPCLEWVEETPVEPSVTHVFNGDEGGGMSEQEREREWYRVYEEKCISKMKLDG